MKFLLHPFEVAQSTFFSGALSSKLLLCGLLFVGTTGRCSAQTLDALNLQLHGYATQGFLYTDHNSWNTTGSENGSAAWTEAVLNVSSQPDPKLRIGIQARYFLLGDLGNTITLDWAQADYKVNERFGFRAGKVKTPVGLYNDSQDIDPAHLWALLPQSIYPLASRNTLLSHYGGVVYGTVPMGETLGRIEYRGFGGQRIVGADDGYFQADRDEGITFPNGITGHIFGGTLRWLAPVRGLTFGASLQSGGLSGKLQVGPATGELTVQKYHQTFYFGKYEWSKLLLAAEYSRVLVLYDIAFAGAPDSSTRTDERPWYVMGSYKITGKLTGGGYYSTIVDRAKPYVSSNYQKDFVVSGRYDFSPFLYAKVEQHSMNGTTVGFAASDNPTLQPKTDMTLVKLGVSF